MLKPEEHATSLLGRFTATLVIATEKWHIKSPVKGLQRGMLPRQGLTVETETIEVAIENPVSRYLQVLCSLQSSKFAP